MCLQESVMNDPEIADGGLIDSVDEDKYAIQTRRKLVRPRSQNQRLYLKNIQANDMAFGIGPAGTGKTYLAVASAIDALETEQVRRIILVRPAVEAGERLGFLPGDMSQKVDPYLRPMYDALFDMIGPDQVTRLMERSIIEIAPLAFMRGRSLNEAFVILDEAQNTSVAQMKMFLTRIGLGSRAVVTGDITQIDLPSGQQSGLRNAIDILADVFDLSNIADQGVNMIAFRIVKFDQIKDQGRDANYTNQQNAGKRFPRASKNPAEACYITIGQPCDQCTGFRLRRRWDARREHWYQGLRYKK